MRSESIHYVGPKKNEHWNFIGLSVLSCAIKQKKKDAQIAKEEI